MYRIDLNCDMGEGMPNDEALMPYISSLNIACGYHAGSEDIMHQTVVLAMRHGVAIGAHPSFPDREHFGRKNLQYSTAEIFDMVSDQLQILSVITKRNGGEMVHVKPHGALYNMAAADKTLATAIAKAVHDFNPALLLFGLAGSQLIAAGLAVGLRTVNEVFADRSYQVDGSLTPRSLAGALINDSKQATRQVLQMIEQSMVTTLDGREIPITAETVCLHGDGLHAVDHAKEIRSALEKRSIRIIAPSVPGH